MQIILEIDPDAFSHPTKYWPQNRRPANATHTVAHENDVMHFLEVQCGLSQANLLPGAYFTEHEEAALLEARRLGRERPARTWSEMESALQKLKSESIGKQES